MWINTKDLSYRDVAKTPGEDFDLGTQATLDIHHGKLLKHLFGYAEHLTRGVYIQMNVYLITQ